MFSKALSAMSIALTAAIAMPAQAQPQSQQDQPGTLYGVQPPPYGEQAAPDYDYGYGRGRYFEFDRGLLNAVNACAYRAARANLGRVIINEVDRTAFNRFRVTGRAQSSGYYGPGTIPYGYPPYGLSFRCTADSWGRVISWSADRRR